MSKIKVFTYALNQFDSAEGNTLRDRKRNKFVKLVQSTVIEFSRVALEGRL